MTTRLKSEVLLARDEVVAAPAKRACDDQTFELPTGLYVAMIFLFAGFVAVLNLAFRGHMGVSFAMIFAFLGAYFAIPTIFVRMNPHPGDAKALDWYEFSRRGIMTATGRTKAKDATVLVLLLPFLIFCFAVAIAGIAAFV